MRPIASPGFPGRDIEHKFLDYPAPQRKVMLSIRELIFSVGKQCGAGDLEESLKWGQPSYRAKKGSPIRIDWHKGEYCLFFHCQSSLVSTFREIYPDTLKFQGQRAICFSSHREMIHRQSELEHCIELALDYHQRKHLPLLGA